jgi:predicted ATPase/class 3 adenylate cyclase
VFCGGCETSAGPWANGGPRKAALLKCPLKGSEEDDRAVASPPTDTVTFLFTDIEGSTRVWERHPEAMQMALARHDEILRTVIDANNGSVVKTAGDGVHAVFSTATDALQAALEAQRALLTKEGWPEETGPLQVRMALHVGATEERDGDYFGPPVNRVARLLSAGHGGQVLLSLATQELVRDQLPPDVEMRNLGEHRLKDLFRPERVFQLVAPGLPAEFPLLRTLEDHPNNLPLQPTPLVGRESEVEEVCGRLRGEEVRLLTLTGPGGTGKTRLALQVGADLVEEFEGGVFFVSLATVTDPELVPSTIAGSLGLRESVERSLEGSLAAYLRQKRLLLILDNFEQVLEGTPVVGTLLGNCPELKVLATSRIPLRLYGEQEYPVPPLELPDLVRLPPPERLTQYEAVRLFVERAKAVKPDFEVANDNAPAVAGICVHLDGLPLAIELAAARTKLLPPQALLSRLGNRLKLLKGGARNLPARQRTLRATMDWSYALLGKGEQTLFGRLSVFSGGFTLESIEEVCDPEGELGALEVVGSLLEKSLLRREEADGKSRFAMLETIQEYARDKLEVSGEAEETRRRHAEFFVALAEEARPKLRAEPQVEWLQRLEQENGNLRAALSWALSTDDIATAAGLSWALYMFWWIRNHQPEGQRWTEPLFLRRSELPPWLRIRTIIVFAAMVYGQGDVEFIEPLCVELMELSQEVGGDAQADANAPMGLGLVATHRGDFEAAREHLEEALPLLREAGEDGLAAQTHIFFGTVLLLEDDREEARLRFEEGLTLGRSIGDRLSICIALFSLAQLALAGGDYDRAFRWFAEGIVPSEELGDRGNIAHILEALGIVAGARGKSLKAARLLGASEALVSAIGLRGHPYYRPDRVLYKRVKAKVRSELGEAAFEAALDEGRTMPAEQAVEYALEEPTRSGEEEGPRSPALGTS